MKTEIKKMIANSYKGKYVPLMTPVKDMRVGDYKAAVTNEVYVFDGKKLILIKY